VSANSIPAADIDKILVFLLVALMMVSTAIN